MARRTAEALPMVALVRGGPPADGVVSVRTWHDTPPIPSRWSLRLLPSRVRHLLNIDEDTLQVTATCDEA